MSGYEALANAIIIQAAKDFKAAYKRMKRFPNSKAAQDEVRDITKFFCSQWFEQLSNVDGPTLRYVNLWETVRKDKRRD